MRISGSLTVHVDDTRAVARHRGRKVFHRVLQKVMQSVNTDKHGAMHSTGIGGARPLR